MNFEEVYKEYLKLVTKQLKKQSLESISRNFNKKILPYFKDKNIEDITKKDYLEWQNTILEFNYTNSYNKLLHSIFSGFLHFCVDYYDLPYNVAHLVGPFKLKYEVPKTDYYTFDEFKKFISCVENPIYKQYFNLLFFTGLRPSEAMALKFDDIQGDYISITKSIQRKGKRELDTPKNISSVRKVKIDKRLKKDLINLKGLYPINNDLFVFGGTKPLAPTTIYRYKLIACQKANIRPITQHQFRHSHATLLVNNNILINEISRRLGHSNVSTTLNCYIHTDLTQEKRVINTLNSLRFNFLKSISRNFKKHISLLKH